MSNPSNRPTDLHRPPRALSGFLGVQLAVLRSNRAGRRVAVTIRAMSMSGASPDADLLRRASASDAGSVADLRAVLSLWCAA